LVKDEEESKKESQSRNTEMSKNVGSIHVRVLGFTRQGLGLKNEGKFAAGDGSFVQTATTTHTDQLRESERERASNTEKLSEKPQQQQQQQEAGS
jgi:hypothetical protein